MRRREFITLLAGAAAWPPGARAQPRVPTIGFLGPTAQQAWTSWTKAFVERFAELGWVDGRTVKIVYRWAHGQTERARRTCHGTGRTQSRPHHHLRQRHAPGYEGDIANSDHLCAGQRAGRDRLCGKPSAAGRQRHRTVARSTRPRRQAPRIFAPG